MQDNLLVNFNLKRTKLFIDIKFHHANNDQSQILVEKTIFINLTNKNVFEVTLTGSLCYSYQENYKTLLDKSVNTENKPCLCQASQIIL